VDKQKVLLILLFFVVSFLVYGSALNNGFVDWDDRLLVVENPIVYGLTPLNIWKAFTSYDPELYIPLTFLSYQIDYVISGLNPFMFHLTNLILHTLNALFVVVFLQLLSRNRLISIVTGLLFLVHPINTEAAVWISARKDLLSSTFFLLALITYLKFLRSGSRRSYKWSVITLAMGLLAKVNVIVAPALFFLLDWNEGRKLSKKSITEKTPHIVICAVFGLIALGGKRGGTELLWDKFLIGIRAVALYLSKIFVPTRFSVLYPYTEPISITTPDIFLSVVLVATLLIISIYTLKKSRICFFSLVFFLIAVAPSFSNIAKGHSYLLDVYIGSDRYPYIASIVIYYLFALLVYKLLSRYKNAFVYLSVILISLLSVISYNQSEVWNSTERLFLHTLKNYPNAQDAHNNIGRLHFERGDFDLAENHFRSSLDIRPTANAYFNLGQVFRERGNLGSALNQFKKAIDTNPFYELGYINIGTFLLREGEAAQSIEYFKKAVELDPSLSISHFNLGEAYSITGETEKAIEAYKNVIKLDPYDAEAAQKIRNLSRGDSR